MPSLPSLPNNDNNKTKVHTRENLGYVDGYAQYTRRSGGHWGPGIQETKKIEKTGVDADKRSGARLNWMFDKQSNNFKKILLGYDNTKISKSDSYEDPTYLIFDVQIDTDHSPLFSKFEDDISALNFMKNYSDSIPELSERLTIKTSEPTDMLSEFQNQFLKLFQTSTPNSTDYPSNGSKQHYIESVSGLDILNKKIINYPEDFIVFTVSEDITLLLQYITELYNNLTFSYDTQRQLIPDNLLRFNLKIILSDFRNMKIETNKILSLMNSGSDIDAFETYEDQINTYKSKMIYILHDCQLNFFDSKSFSDGITRGGFGSSKPNEISKNIFKINFKSVSRIMAPLSIDNSFVIDLREREKLEMEQYTTIYEQLDIGDDVIIMKDGTKKRKFMDKVKGAIKNELTEVRNIIVNQLKQEVGDLASRVNDWIVEKTGMSAVKLNVYQDTPGQKLGKINVKITNYIDKKVGDFLGNNDEEQQGLKEKSGNIYKTDFRRRTPNTTLDKQDVYGDLNEINGVHYPSYNQKYPSGDVHPDGQYNNKTPDSDFGFITDVHEDGKYNEKYPDGDVHEDGIYNEKYPNGTVQPKGKYNEKYPNGDVHPDGQYNTKYPEGDVHEDSKYNLKYPEGDVHEDGKYNQKYPSGDVHADGQYNEKYPNGDVQSDGIYNQKYPNGTVQPKGNYNEKYPENNIDYDSKYNEKYPNGNVHSKGNYNEKYPSGDVHKDGQYNEKYPDGKLHEDGQYNEKKPNGQVQSEGNYNEKYPDGSVQPKGNYNDKKPNDDDIKIKNAPIYKYPNGNVYKK